LTWKLLPVASTGPIHYCGCFRVESYGKSLQNPSAGNPRQIVQGMFSQASNFSKKEITIIFPIFLSSEISNLAVFW
jgi:hypothetical protein